MNLEKLTERSKGFLQAAQTVAIRMNHQQIAPEHLLKALLEDEQGMASGLIKAAGGDAPAATRGVDAALAKVPAVSGGGAQQTPGMNNDLVRVIDQAEQVATNVLEMISTSASPLPSSLPTVRLSCRLPHSLPSPSVRLFRC